MEVPHSRRRPEWCMIEEGSRCVVVVAVRTKSSRYSIRVITKFVCRFAHRGATLRMVEGANYQNFVRERAEVTCESSPALHTGCRCVNFVERFKSRVGRVRVKMFWLAEIV